MKFGEVADYYERLESTTKRLEMQDILIDLINGCPEGLVDKVLYLTQGKLAADYVDLELGLADKLLMKTISTLKGVPEKEISAKFAELGDLGAVTQHYYSLKTQKSLMDWGGADESDPLLVEEVHADLLKLAGKKAKDSQAMKMDILKRMLQRAGPVEGKYLVRIVTKNMRLGVKDLSILDSLAHIYSPEFADTVQAVSVPVSAILDGFRSDTEDLVMAMELLEGRKATSIPTLEEAVKSVKRAIKAGRPGNAEELLQAVGELEEMIPYARDSVKATRAAIENAYNLCSDIGIIARNLKSKGLAGLDSIELTVGIPIRSMLAERLTSLEDILAKLGGECALEYKYDGLRLQVHISENGIELFSRGLENMTHQFPDVIEAAGKAFKGNDGIFDGECIPLDPNTGDVLPFQYISRRARRKYDLSSSVKSQTLDEFQAKGYEEKIPVALVLFDCLSIDGEDLTGLDYPSRRRRLEGAFDYGKSVSLAVQKVVSTIDSANDFFSASIESGCEGIIAKSLGPESVYKAGSRGFIWIKFKRDYKMELGDSLDLVVVGAFHGHGRRTGVYGAFLMAVFNPETGMLETVCKLGTGFDDPTLQSLYARLSLSVVDSPVDHLLKHTNMKPDVHFQPELVLEVRGAEITYSPVHTCALSQLKEDFGLAIRFPRFTGRFREDKQPEDATTTQEAVSMFKNQARRD